MIQWTESIPKGTPMEEVAAHTPEFLEVDWAHPDTVDGLEAYRIQIQFDGQQILRKRYFVVFEDGQYRGRRAID
ncbi:hypothetical protein [Pontibacter sp. G13]|uniref:hypothetical protein n=1 Tax=Pontibacter sp. G13 TaxID=3074898 RepID=UPI00288A3478|nr:hypothetical protein [Pontibacter sp. G13]WNJ19842.1 hypothetical protein RJD25_05110 [Pontibacter sp. G13]